MAKGGSHPEFTIRNAIAPVCRVIHLRASGYGGQVPGLGLPVLAGQEVPRRIHERLERRGREATGSPGLTFLRWSGITPPCLLQATGIRARWGVLSSCSIRKL